MIAYNIITEEIPPLNHTDTGEKALLWMDEFKVNHLPVLKHGNFVGVVSESDILDRVDAYKTLDELFDHLPRPFVFANAHIYTVFACVSEFKLSTIPILDENEEYLGCTSTHYLIQLIGNLIGMREKGGVIVLELNQNDYSMAHIAQIVEQNNAKILNAYITSIADSTKIEVTLKLSETDLDRILRTFERYEYSIKAYFHRSPFEDDLKDRFDSMMNFLNY